MRDCVFWVADKSMGETFFGFLSREDRCAQLGCGPFEFDRNEDLFVATGQNDPGIFKRADELLRPFQNTHRKAVVVLDCDWDTSPGQIEIRDAITQQLKASGWDAQRFIVIAIDPELEQWIWQDSPVLESALRHHGPQSLRATLSGRNLWPDAQVKPPKPKEVFIQIQHENGVKKSSSVFRRIASEVPIAACTDTEFQCLVNTLRAWFPAEGAA
jgi:hypothetical protein